VRRARKSKRAFFTTDALVGLIVVAALASALAVTAGQQRRSITRLANSRAAIHLADRAMVSLQTSRTLPETSADEGIAVAPLPDDAPPGQQWVCVTATVRGRSFELVGLVPRQGAP
jgi:hypothetical protein